MVSGYFSGSVLTGSEAERASDYGKYIYMSICLSVRLSAA